MKDFYKILQVPPSSSFPEIKHSYRSLSKKYHPDLNNGDKVCEEKFKDILEAYSVLKEPLKRKDYDLKLESHRSRLQHLIRPASSETFRPLKKTTHVKSFNVTAEGKVRKNQISKKEIIMAAGGLCFLLVVATTVITLERRMAVKESFLENVELTSDPSAGDSIYVKAGLSLDSVYTSNSAHRTRRKHR